MWYQEQSRDQTKRFTISAIGPGPRNVTTATTPYNHENTQWRSVSVLWQNPKQLRNGTIWAIGLRCTHMYKQWLRKHWFRLLVIVLLCIIKHQLRLTKMKAENDNNQCSVTANHGMLVLRSSALSGAMPCTARPCAATIAGRPGYCKLCFIIQLWYLAKTPIISTVLCAVIICNS